MTRVRAGVEKSISDVTESNKHSNILQNVGMSWGRNIKGVMGNEDMDIFVDDNMSRDWFFISIPLSEKESISFDWTMKGHRTILQRMVESKEPMPEGNPTMEWDTLYIRGGKYIGKEHVRWYDMGKKDWVNGQLYEAVQEWPLDDNTANGLLKYSLIVRDHKSELGSYSKEMQEFEVLLNKLIRMTYGNK